MAAKNKETTRKIKIVITDESGTLLDFSDVLEVDSRIQNFAILPVAKGKEPPFDSVAELNIGSV